MRPSKSYINQCNSKIARLLAMDCIGCSCIAMDVFLHLPANMDPNTSKNFVLQGFVSRKVMQIAIHTDKVDTTNCTVYYA